MSELNFHTLRKCCPKILVKNMSRTTISDGTWPPIWCTRYQTCTTLRRVGRIYEKKDLRATGPARPPKPPLWEDPVSHAPFARSFDLLHPPGAEPCRPRLVAAGPAECQGHPGHSNPASPVLSPRLCWEKPLDLSILPRVY